MRGPEWMLRDCKTISPSFVVQWLIYKRVLAAVIKDICLKLAFLKWWPNRDTWFQRWNESEAVVRHDRMSTPCRCDMEVTTLAFCSNKSSQPRIILEMQIYLCYDQECNERSIWKRSMMFQNTCFRCVNIDSMQTLEGIADYSSYDAKIDCFWDDKTKSLKLQMSRVY